MAAAAILKIKINNCHISAGILLLCAQFSHGLVNSAMGQTLSRSAICWPAQVTTRARLGVINSGTWRTSVSY